MDPAILIWLGIVFCITQSAMFSGLNLAFFSLTRLQLEGESENGSRAARRILALRTDANFLLTTILWGNVGINVLLTLLSNSVLAGVAAFLFSTILITFGGEILPQAYFSRNALRMASLLAPVLRFYQVILFPVRRGDDVIDNDLILVWTDEERRIITGADILGRLLRGISTRVDWRFAAAAPTTDANAPGKAIVP